MSYSHLDDNEYNITLSHLDNINARDRAVVGLMLLAGLRVGEVCCLKSDDIFRSAAGPSGVSVRNGHCRSDHLRYIQCHPRLSNYLAAHMATDEYIMYSRGPGKPFFVSRISKRPLEPRSIQRICAATFLSWIGRRVNPHALRHTFATRVLRTSNLRVVQQLLGHASISSTQLYTHPSSQEEWSAISTAF